MKLDKDDLLLYAITDRSFHDDMNLVEQVKDAILGGITCLQIREKKLDENLFINEAKEIKEITDQYHLPLIINDNVNVAKIIDATGVHIGQEDMDIKETRKILGDKIIGVSVQNVQQAIQAQKDGANYLGVGAIFQTSSKLDAADVSIEMLRDICDAVCIPVVAIGGISLKNINLLKNTDIAGISVISAVFASDNIKQAASDLLDECKDLLR